MQVLLCYVMSPVNQDVPWSSNPQGRHRSQTCTLGQDSSQEHHQFQSTRAWCKGTLCQVVESVTQPPLLWCWASFTTPASLVKQKVHNEYTYPALVGQNGLLYSMQKGVNWQTWHTHTVSTCNQSHGILFRTKQEYAFIFSSICLQAFK